MARYIALLRGINVGRNRRVSMVDLRRVLTDLGATDVATHLQSGNAVFSHAGSAAKVSSGLAKSLSDDLDLTVPIVVRTAGQLEKALAGDPFGDIADDPARHLLGFCSEQPTKTAVAALTELIEARQAKGGQDSADRWQLDRDHVYLWCASNVHESIFATVKWDKVLGVEVTMRNWSTATRLLELARS